MAFGERYLNRALAESMKRRTAALPPPSTREAVPEVRMSDIESRFDPGELRVRRELAAAYRLLAHFGMTDLIFTHVSARLPGTDDRFLINPYGLLFEEITASNLLVVDLDGNVIGPSEHPVNPAGFVIHAAVHRARPDVGCVVHTHTRSGCAVSAQQGGLLPLTQTALEFYGRIGYHVYEGVALNRSEQDRLVADLGTHNALVLRNHGMLTVGTDAGQAFLRMFNLDRACQIQTAALAGNVAVTIPPTDVCELAAQQLNEEQTCDDFVDDLATELAWQAMLRLVDRIAPEYAH